MSISFDIENIVSEMAYEELIEENEFLHQIIKNHMTVSNKKEEELPSIIMSDPFNLESNIMNLLSKYQNGLTAKEIIKYLPSSNIKKTNINSILYKFLSKKKIIKTNDKCPVWKLSL